jgi:hypothetical protein
VDNLFSLSPISYVLASVQCDNCSHNDKSFPAIPKMPGSIGPKWFGLRPLDNSGLGHATISDAVPLTPIGNPVPGYQELFVAPNESLVGLVKNIRSPNGGMVWQ